MSRRKTNILLVEGEKDKRVIPHLMGHFIAWGERHEPEKWPADIKPFGGVDDLLKPGVIGAELKSPGLEALGIMVDANGDPAGRWGEIRRAAIGSIPTMPMDLPAEGLVCEDDEGLRFGVWLMPDNKATGMLETLMAMFVPDRGIGLWPFVVAHCLAAKEQHNAPYRDVHLDKAQIYAWLALQDEPGEQLHIAVMKRILQPSSPLADPFVNWFCKLFSAQRLSSSTAIQQRDTGS